jgi:hypothetical protein
MARDPRLATLRRTLLTRRAGWGLAAAFALLGIVLGAHRLGPDRFARAARLVGQALADGAHWCSTPAGFCCCWPPPA